MLRATAHAVSTRGVRPANEDTVSLFGWQHSLREPADIRVSAQMDRALLVVVADGMGGHAAGERASAVVVAGLNRNLDRLTSADALRDVLVELDAELRHTMEDEPETRGMGTTVAGMLFYGSAAATFNVGDSRVYLQSSDGCLRRISTDDARQPATGERSREVLRAIGGSAKNRTDLDPHVRTLRVSPGDRFLLCSDGLSDWVHQSTMEAILLRIGEPQVCRALHDEAIRGGSDDNISVVLVSFDDPTHQRAEGQIATPALEPAFLSNDDGPIAHQPQRRRARLRRR